MLFCIFLYILCVICVLYSILFQFCIIYYLIINFKKINFNICISFCQKVYNILICSSIFKYFKLYFDII